MYIRNAIHQNHVCMLLTKQRTRMSQKSKKKENEIKLSVFILFGFMVQVVRWWCGEKEFGVHSKVNPIDSSLERSPATTPLLLPLPPEANINSTTKRPTKPTRFSFLRKNYLEKKSRKKTEQSYFFLFFF